MKQPKLDLDRLFVFTQTVAAGTLTKAAQKMNMNQSCVSRKIMALQEDLGCSLLTYVPRKGITLTSEGQIVYDTAVNLLQQSSNLEITLQNFGVTKHPTLYDFLTLDFFDISLLDSLRNIRNWGKAHQIYLSTDQEISEKLSYIHITNILPKSSKLNFQKLLTRTYGLYGSNEYLKIKGIPTVKSDLYSPKILALESQINVKENICNTIL